MHIIYKIYTYNKYILYFTHTHYIYIIYGDFVMKEDGLRISKKTKGRKLHMFRILLFQDLLFSKCVENVINGFPIGI